MKLLQSEKQAIRDACCAIISSLEKSDPYAFSYALEEIDIAGAWRQAFLSIRRWEGNLSDTFRQEMSGIWGAHGWTIRSNVSDDKLLVDVLALLFPPYTGSDIILYRGESFANRKYRRYGLSWTSSLEAGQQFALDQSKDNLAGAVLLRANIPAKAIIADVHKYNPEGYEFEYIVDRRYLKGIRIDVLERLPSTLRAEVNIDSLIQSAKDRVDKLAT